MTGSREAALKMEALSGQASALATAAYESSGQYQMLNDTELDQIAAIRDSIVATDNLTGALNSYRVSQEQSKGMGGGALDVLTAPVAKNFVGRMERRTPAWPAGRRRAGLPSVWTGCLTTTFRPCSTRGAGADGGGGPGGGSGGQAGVSGDGDRKQLHGDREEMADQVAEVLVRKLERAAVTAAPR